MGWRTVQPQPGSSDSLLAQLGVPCLWNWSLLWSCIYWSSDTLVVSTSSLVAVRPTWSILRLGCKDTLPLVLLMKTYCILGNWEKKTKQKKQRQKKIHSPFSSPVMRELTFISQVLWNISPAKNQPIWTGGIFQKEDDFLDTFQRKYFCWFFKKLWVVFLRKATEWLPVKMQFWVLKLDSLICILNTLLKRQWQCLFSKRYKYKRKQFRNEIGRKIQSDLEKRFFNFCFGIFRKVLGKKSLSYNSSVLPIQDNHFGLLLLCFVLCRNSHLGHHMSPKYSLLL